MSLDRLVAGDDRQPHGSLGWHDGVVTALRPGADAMWLVPRQGGRRKKMTDLGEGVFTVAQKSWADYRFDVVLGKDTYPVEDPYRFPPVVSDDEALSIGAGTHGAPHRVMGGRLITHEGVEGASFLVLAPHARGVRLAGDFNHWDPRLHPLRLLAGGVWELFVPGAQSGQRYRLDVLGSDWVWRQKADPYALRADAAPGTASVLWRSEHVWTDDGWLAQRKHPADQPMSIYEVHLGSWREGLDYDGLARELPAYARDMGFTHVELMPVTAHPFGGSWGYQVSSYLAPDGRLGDPDGFARLVDALHAAGIGVIVDWVPAHFPRDTWLLERFDGTALYEHHDPQRADHPDWGTLIFDYARPAARELLLGSALHLVEDLHIDGLRVDAVASMLYLDYGREAGQWTPNEHGGHEDLAAVAFLRHVNDAVHAASPGVVVIAEESTAWPGVTTFTDHGGLGFDFKWDMGWMHDSLSYLKERPEHRLHHHNKLTFAAMYANSERFVLPLSHDEVVHGKGALANKAPGNEWERLATLRTLLAWMWTHPGKKLLFMGAELGQMREWSHDRGIDWWLLDNADHLAVQQTVRDLAHTYSSLPPMWSRDSEGDRGMQWLDANDGLGNTFAMLRFDGEGSYVASAVRFAMTPLTEYRIGLPHEGPWRIALYVDPTGAEAWMSDVEDVPHQGQPWSARIRLPGPGAVWLAPAAQTQTPDDRSISGSAPA